MEIIGKVLVERTSGGTPPCAGAVESTHGWWELELGPGRKTLPEVAEGFQFVFTPPRTAGNEAPLWLVEIYDDYRE